jgi:hypothetical protein
MAAVRIKNVADAVTAIRNRTGTECRFMDRLAH